MTDRESADRQLGMYIAIGLVVGALLGALAVVLVDGTAVWIVIGAGIGLVLATALTLGQGPDEG